MTKMHNDGDKDNQWKSKFRENKTPAKFSEFTISLAGQGCNRVACTEPLVQL